MDKPPDLFDRSWEWGRLSAFSTDVADRPLLGVVSGRRRQGKSVLVRALAAAAGGFYWEAFEGSRADLLADLATRLAARLRSPAPVVLRDWDTALGALGTLGTVVVLDELPYALRESPEITS